MTDIDGKKQRNALTAVERALSSLGAGKPEAARKAIARATTLDQLGIYSSVVGPVERAADDLSEANAISDERWDEIADALGPGPLAGLVDQLRS